MRSHLAGGNGDLEPSRVLKCPTSVPATYPFCSAREPKSIQNLQHTIHGYTRLVARSCASVLCAFISKSCELIQCAGLSPPVQQVVGLRPRQSGDRAAHTNLNLQHPLLRRFTGTLTEAMASTARCDAAARVTAREPTPRRIPSICGTVLSR